MNNNQLTTEPPSASPSANPIKEHSKTFPWIICGLGALFYCYEYFLRISPSVMTTDLMHAFQINATALGNLTAFYYYAYTPMQLPVGVLMDHYGPRRLLIFACLLCAIGTYLFGMPGHLFIAQIGRFLVGFGSAFAFVGVLKLATIWLPANRFALVSGLATTLGMIGAMAGDISLSVLVQAQGWHSTVLLSAIGGIIIALVIGLVMPDTKNQSTHSQLADFRSLFEGSLKLIKDYRIWLNGLIGCILYLPLSAFAELWGVPYLENAHHFSKVESAHAISIVFLGWAIGGPLFGYLSDRIRHRILPVIWGSIATAITIAAILYVPGLNHTTLLTLLFLCGVFCSVEIIVFAIARDISPSYLSGTALALTNMIVMLGGVIFQPAIGLLLDIHRTIEVSVPIQVYSAADYQLALAALPIVALLAAGLSLLIKDLPPPSLDK